MAAVTQATLIISAGAPTTPLMCGALAAIHEAGKYFNVIYTSGGGCLVGLMYIASRGVEPPEGLRRVMELAISDDIYRFFPVDYKVFHKGSPFTQLAYRLTKLFQVPERLAQRPYGLGWPIDRSDRQRYLRLYNDLVAAWFSILTPSNVTFFSQGICDPFPFLDDWIDFQKVKTFTENGGKFFMNAYNISHHEMEEFSGDQIDRRHFLAALSFPFIYPPTEIDGNFYSEGADFDPINFPNLLKHIQARDLLPEGSYVLMDVLGSLEKAIIRTPRNLWDAYGLSVITPAVSLAKKNLQLFEDQDNFELDSTGSRVRVINLYKMQFEIPHQQWPYITDWSYSNMQQLWDIGYRTGQEFCRRYPDLLLSY